MRRLAIVLLAVAILNGLAGAVGASEQRTVSPPEPPSGAPSDWVEQEFGSSFATVRARLGLGASPELIAQLVRDPEAMERGMRWGAPVSEKELQLIETQARIESETAGLLDEIYRADPKSYAGARDDGDGLFVMISDDASPAADVARRAGVAVVAVERSMDDFYLATETISASSGVALFFDPLNDRVEAAVGSEAKATELLDKLAALGFSSVDVEVKVDSLYETDEVGYGFNRTDPGHPCRPAHCSPVVGGQFYNCTLGFGVEERFGTAWGQGWASAGHCTEAGDTPFRTRWVTESGIWNSASWWRLRSSYNTIPGNTARSSTINSTRDIGWQRGAARLGPSNTMFQEDAVHWRAITGVRNWWQLVGGANPTRVCASWGRQSDAPQCGPVQLPGQYLFRMDLTADPQGDLSVGGDSGSPYWIEGAPWLAVGVHGGDVDTNVTYATSVTALPETQDANVITDTNRHHVLVASLYGRAYNRHPDQSGWNYWTGQACSLANIRTMVRFFYKDGEFETLYDTDGFDSLDHVKTTLRKLYRGALGREPDPSGLNSWSAHIWAGGGDSAREARWNETVDFFSNSPELITRYATGAIGEGGLGLCAT